MSIPFKMKGSPMQRNFGVSPMRHELGEKGKVSTRGHNKIYGAGHSASTSEEHEALKPTRASISLENKKRKLKIK